MANDQLIYGLRPILQAVQDGQTIDKVFLQKGISGPLYTQLEGTLRDAGIEPKYVPVEKLNRVTSGNHQGAVAYLSPIDFHELEEVIMKVVEDGRKPLILALDRITDVRNFGAIARTAECAGVDAIIIPEQNAAAINADSIKTSAGALHKITVCRTWNLKLAIQFMKESGIQLVGCTEKTQDMMYKPDYTPPTAIIMGSEEDGVSPEFLKMCDARAKIPLAGKIASLNVSVATGVILYEAIRQRG